MRLSRRQVLGAAAAAVTTGMVCACKGRAPSAHRVAPGERVAPARRIVSLAPPVTEMLFALGAGDRVVGVSTFCDFPAAATRLPRVGSMVAPVYESIRALHPDAIVAVVGPVNTVVIERLKADGVRALAPRVESFDDVRRALDTLASLGGRPGAAEVLRACIDADLARVRSAVEGRRRPRVVAVHHLEPLVLAGRGSWVDEVLGFAGGENAVQSASRFPMVAIEQVLAWVPEVVLDLTSSTPPLTEAWAQYNLMPAVANHRILRVDSPLLRSQGPRIAEAAALVARALHPGVSV